MGSPDATAARHRLEEERALLLAGRDADRDDPQGPAGAVIEPDDPDPETRDIEGGTEEYRRSQDLGLTASADEQIAEVDAALARVADGTYGRCQTCGRPIADERLEALPATRYCAEDAFRAEEVPPIPPGAGS